MDQASDNRWRELTAVLALLTLLGALWVGTARAQFPRGGMFNIEVGTTLAEVAEELAAKQMIKSTWFFTAVIRLAGGERAIKAGDYLFERQLTDLEVAWRLLSGHYSNELAKVTIPEGATVKEIARLIGRKIPNFAQEEFITLATPEEGYLFPDTYFVSSAISPANLIRTMRANLDEQLRRQHLAIVTSGRPFNEIMVMASLLEKEAPAGEARRIISDILWKRVESGKPLQVDAVFPYILGKNTYSLTRQDLEFDSPYNTYKYPGLPPAPISNPGLDAIVAALEPIETPYWYYLSNRSGKLYYATTYAEHTKNRRLYLNST